MSAFRSFVCICGLGILVGCGESRVTIYPVSGSVVFDDGSPVRTGTIELYHPEHQLTATGTIQQDGTFKLGTYSSDDGACEGTHKVIVTQFIINDGTVKHTLDHGKAVDPFFASYNSSTLTATVAASETNSLKVTVTARGKTP